MAGSLKPSAGTANEHLVAEYVNGANSWICASYFDWLPGASIHRDFLFDLGLMSLKKLPLERPELRFPEQFEAKHRWSFYFNYSHYAIDRSFRLGMLWGVIKQSTQNDVLSQNLLNDELQDSFIAQKLDEMDCYTDFGIEFP